MDTIVFPPCQREGCTEPGHHWHRYGDDVPTLCLDAENCADPWSKVNPIGCVSARVPAASHTRPDAKSDSRVQAWLTVAKHPFFADCYSVDDTLLNAVLAKLDAAHAHTCEPVWRPVTFAEIQPGWMIRSRSDAGFEMKCGVTDYQDEDGDWFTEAGSLLTRQRFGWTYETTAPEPEPKPDPRVGLLEGVCLREGVVLTRSDVAMLLSIADAVAPTNH